MNILYLKYRKFLKIFKTVQNVNNVENLEWKLEDKYGTIANEAVSILRAKGGITQYSMFHECKNSAKLNAIILEYEDKCNSMLWGFIKWTIGTVIAVAGLYIAYLTFTK